MDNPVSYTVEGVTQMMRDLVQRATGWITAIGPVLGVEPANQYCIVTLRRQYKQPRDVIKYRKNSQQLLEEHQRGESTLTFEVQARGLGAMDALDRLTGWLDSEIRDVDFWGYLGSGGRDEAINISTYHQGKVLEAGVINIYINANITKTNSPEWFNVVDISVFKDNNEIVKITVPDAEQDEENNQ